MTKYGRQCYWRQEDINITVRKVGERIGDDIATAIAPIHRLGIHHFWNALKKASECKSLAERVLVLMAMPLAEAGNERIFSLKRDIIGRQYQTVARSCPDQSSGRSKVIQLPNQEQILFVIIAFILIFKAANEGPLAFDLKSSSGSRPRNDECALPHPASPPCAREKTPGESP
jgi:hypothetical protein